MATIDEELDNTPITPLTPLTDNTTNPVDPEYFRDCVENNRWQEIRRILSEMNPPAVADLLGDIEEQDKLLVIFKLLSKDQAAAIFTYLDADLHRYIIEGITSDDINDLLKRMFVDDAVDLLEELPANMVSMILSAAPPEKRTVINHALKYPENSAGSIMTVEYISLMENMTIENALAHVRKHGVDRETIYNCYVTNESRKIAGAVSLRAILLAPNNALIKDIMTTQVIFAHTMDDQEGIAHIFQEYDLNAMPVVDNEDRLVGIITIDDIVDVIEAENTEDFEKMAALHPNDDEYLKTGIFKLARNRIIWLLVLMISATATGAVIGHYQNLLASAAFLAAFIPMLMDTGGNCGAQASTLVIRGMAVGEIELRCWYKIVWKEFRVGIVVGVALTAVNWLRMRIFSGNVMFGDVSRVRVETVVSITLFIIVIFAKLIGCILPMTAKRLHFDPALMASPMLTTIVDAVALTLFFSVAEMFIRF